MQFKGESDLVRKQHTHGLMRLLAPAPGTKRWLRRGLIVATALGVGFALRDASMAAGELAWPSASEVVTALALSATALLLAALSWGALFTERSVRVEVLARGFLYAQLAKYVPGGVLQVARLYELSRRAGLTRRDVSVGMPVSALSATVAPGALAGILLAVVGGHLSPWIRLLLAVGGVAGFAVAVSRALVGRLFDALKERVERVPGGEALPSQRAILRSFTLGLAATACSGVGYSVLLDVGGVQARIVSALGFVVAFTVGFLALPAPSGLGIREAVLIALLLDVAPIASLLAAAVAIRIVQVTAELAVAGSAAAVSRLFGRAGARGGSPW